LHDEHCPPGNSVANSMPATITVNGTCPRLNVVLPQWKHFMVNAPART